MRITLPSLVSKLTLFSATSSLFGETPEQVAQRGRLLLDDPSIFGVGILSTTYQDDYSDASLRGLATGGPEYFASCFDNGDLLMIAMPVSQNWRNALSSSSRNATMIVSSSPDPAIPDPRHTDKDGHAWDPNRPSWRRGMPSKQRMTLYGHLDRIAKEEADKVSACYLKQHPDAEHWAPGSDESPHVAFWTRFVVDRIYRVGGFGDEANIGWIDMDLWHKGNTTAPASSSNSPSPQTSLSRDGNVFHKQG